LEGAGRGGLVLSILCYPAHLVMKEQTSRRAAASIKEMGIPVSFLNGYTIGDQRVLGLLEGQFEPGRLDHKARAICLRQPDRAGRINLEWHRTDDSTWPCCPGQ
jgi:hypothetical protein